MKRRSHLLPMIAEPENLRWAFVRARRGKTYSREVLRFQSRLGSELRTLREELLTGRYRPGGYRRFVIYEPKERQICAGSFRDNVVHHAIMNICHEDFERKQIDDSYACRLGKGTHTAVARAQGYARKHAWYLKLDVRNFFASVHHVVIREQLARLFKDPHLLTTFSGILASYSADTDRGLPLGNLTSQYFANHYLTPVDRYGTQSLRIGAYVRYMDDLVLWSDRRAELKYALRSINNLVENDLRCTLKPPVLQRSRLGLSYLGYRIFPHHVRLTHASRKRLGRKFWRIDREYRSGQIDEAAAARRAQALVAFAAHAESIALRRALLKNVDIRNGREP